MTEFGTMTCKTCRGKLQITPEIDEFACIYCGTEFRVIRKGELISISPLVDETVKVSTSTDETASELTINRLKEEIKDLKNEISDEKQKLNAWKENKYELIEENKIIAGRYKGICIGVLVILSVYLTVIYTSEFPDPSPLFFLGTVLIFGIFYFILIFINPLDIFKKDKNKDIQELIKSKEREFTDKENIYIQLIFKKEEEIKEYINKIGG